MSEREAVERTKSPVTVGSLCGELTSLGIRRGDTVLVHSSLSSLGWVCGSAVAVIQSLTQTLGSAGTLVMPAHSCDNSDPSQWQNPPVPREWVDCITKTMPAFDKRFTPTRGMGVIAEAFRSYPGVLRSDHPQTSFCAWGRRAAQVTGSHPLTPQMGMDSPVGQLYKLNAKILLLGVDYDKCTSLHLSETLWERMPRIRYGASVQSREGRRWVWFEDYDYDSSDFAQIGEDFEKACPVNKGYVGNAYCRLIPVRPAVDYALEWMRANRM